MINHRRLEPKTLTPAERDARKVFAAQEAEKALNDYEAQQRAFHANRERLKAERLARETAATKTLSIGTWLQEIDSESVRSLADPWR